MVLLNALALLLPAVYGGVYASIGPVADLEIVNRVIAPDGYQRSTTLAGGSFPGPIIRGMKGDNFSINVIDCLTDTSMNLGTSIHWHGIFQKNTNYDDGVASVTQCPLIPSESFLYSFNSLDQTGTYWYHSHYKMQYCDGLRGVFIIEDPDDPQRYLYDVDDDSTVITLADWLHFSSTIAPQIPTFNSTLINGKGNYPGSPSQVELATVNVSKGMRYRFRLVAISCSAGFLFSIDGHTMTVIEVEGNNVQPLEVDSLVLLAGQRYSVVVEANQDVDNYWIRALPNSPGQNFSDLTNLAVLHYAGAANANPTEDPTANIPVSVQPLVETDLHPGNPFPGGADININLDVTFDRTLGNFLVNGVAFDPPTVPVLLQILSGTKNASELVPAGSIYGLQRNKSVELTIPAVAVGAPHPIHLHGHSFSVVRSAGSSSYNFDTAVIRDVVSIGNTGDNVTIRFFTDNVGPWFLHCHIDFHLAAGFAAVFAEDVPDVASQVIPSDQWRNLCPIYDDFVDATGHA
ncbi:laccase [Lactarius tabidus]